MSDSTSPALFDALSKTSLFRGLSSEGLARVAEITSEETYRTGHILFREGEPGDKLYVILSGRVRISREVPGMGEEALAILDTGDSFGEMSLVDDAPRSADARVHEKCRLLVITKEALEDLLFLDKELAYEILWNIVKTLSGRLRETNDKMTFLSNSGRF